MLTPIRKSGRYISIKADGLFHEKVSQGTEGAVLRPYELKDGTKGEKWELLYEDMKNVYIVGLGFEDSEYGENILVTFRDEDDNEVILSEGTSTNFGTDLMKKLPNVDFAEKVTIKPYAFQDEKTSKDRRGVTIYQNGKKVKNFFYDEDTKTEINGFPTPEGDTTTYDKDDWKMYYIKVKKFLVGNTKDNVIPKLCTPVSEVANETPAVIEYPDEEINPEDVPF